MGGIVLTARGLVSPVADEPIGLMARIRAGTSGRGPITEFDTENLGCHEAVCMAGFDPKEFLGNHNFRPLNRPALFAILAVERCLRDAVLQESEESLGLVVGTMFCSMHTISAFDLNAQKVGPKYAKPMDFANTVINAVAGQSAIWHALRGLNSTVAAGFCSSTLALAHAADYIRAGRCRQLLAGGVEEVCRESLLSFDRAGLTAGDQRPGVILGEGAAFLLLEDEAHARRRGAHILGELLGFASGYDRWRGQRHNAAVAAANRCFENALSRAGVEAAEVDLVCVSANGYPATDRVEEDALDCLFAGHPVERLAIKPCVGEMMGASGAFQVVAALEAGKPGRTVLVANLGFEGSVSALVLRVSL